MMLHTLKHRPVTFDFLGVITASPKMRDFLRLVERVSKTDTSVLIRGETGVGKELIARAIHQLSSRSSHPFQAVNCATLTSDHLASELFGHVRGAFTGAHRDRRGLFQLANGGTLFLDEVAEMPLDIQARLLRVLQERTFVPLGASEPIRADVRVLAATHKALRSEVAQGRFREDLMYRIRVVPLYLPRLVERAGDVEALAMHFIEQLNQRGGRQIEAISPEACRLMCDYSWPGNVRELKNVIEYAFAIGEGATLGLSDLTPELRGVAPATVERHEALVDPRRVIREALIASGGHKQRAAESLGISRTTLWRRMRELGL